MAQCLSVVAPYGLVLAFARGSDWGFAASAGVAARSQAHKRIVDDRYCFLVEFSIPLFGMVLRYAGELDLIDRAASDPAIAPA